MKPSMLLRNDSGIAVLVALIMLFVVTIAGITIIVGVSKDRISSNDVCAIANVSFAANASLFACEKQFINNPGVAIEILNKYIKDNSYKWMLCSDAGLSNNMTILKIADSRMKYAVQISAFDKVNNVIQVIGTGFGSSSEQKNVTAIYKLTGLKLTVPSHNVKYALYLAGSGRNFDKVMDITGDVYCGSDFHFNSGAANTLIHGVLKTGKNTALESSSDATGLSVDSAIYIGTKFKINNDVVFKGKAGIEGHMNIGATLTVNNEAWFNDTNDGNLSINMSGNSIHHSGQIKMSRVINAVEDNCGAYIANIAEQVSLGLTNDNAWTVDTTGLNAKALLVPANATSDIINKMYDTCSPGNRYKGYLVLSDGSYGANLAASSTSFNCRVIWLIKNSLSANGTFSTMSQMSRMIVYAYANAQINGFGGPNNSVFNGVVFLSGNSKINLSGTGRNTINGAIHIASPSATWQLNSGSAKLYLVYSDDIINEFVSMGIISLPLQPPSASSGVLTLTDVKIRPEQIAVLY